MKRLLLVEDDPDIRYIARLVLERRFEVEEAEDGPTALAIGSNFTPDVVLMDLMMPGIDGIETLKRMRQTSWGADIVAILMTARSAFSDPEVATHGFAAMIPKPFDPLALDAHVEGFL